MRASEGAGLKLGQRAGLKGNRAACLRKVTWRGRQRAAEGGPLVTAGDCRTVGLGEAGAWQ